MRGLGPERVLAKVMLGEGGVVVVCIGVEVGVGIGVDERAVGGFVGGGFWEEAGVGRGEERRRV